MQNMWFEHVTFVMNDVGQSYCPLFTVEIGVESLPVETSNQFKSPSAGVDVGSTVLLSILVVQTVLTASLETQARLLAYAVGGVMVAGIGPAQTCLRYRCQVPMYNTQGAGGLQSCSMTVRGMQSMLIYHSCKRTT